MPNCRTAASPNAPHQPTRRPDKIDAKGIELVRRDNCLLVRKVITTALDKILLEADTEGAVSYVKSTISELLQNKLDMSLLVITKVLGVVPRARQFVVDKENKKWWFMVVDCG